MYVYHNVATAVSPKHNNYNFTYTVVRTTPIYCNEHAPADRNLTGLCKLQGLGGAASSRVVLLYLRVPAKTLL